MRPLPRALPFLAALLALALAAAAAAQPREGGKVTLPLSQWQAMQDALRQGAAPGRDGKSARGAPLWIARRIEGRFHKGLWSGRLTGRFELAAGEGARVPLIDARATIVTATIDGRPAALLSERGMYAVVVGEPGRHEIAVDFDRGRETQRFTRMLRLDLPPGGPVAIVARIAEHELSASLAGGALTSATEVGGDTVIAGQLDGAAALDLSWKRRATEEARGEAKWRAQQDTIFKVSEALVSGRSAIRVQVLEGETDAVTLGLPPGVEVVRVEGDAVLQWRTSLAANEQGKLIVLLRHLVTDAAEIRIDFQLPGEPGAPLELAMPAPDAPTTGSIGVVGPPGLAVEAKQVDGAEALAPRDLPAELTALTDSPVLFGFRFEQAPRVAISIARLAELELTSTLVDELQASTVLQEDGTERTKIKLAIRNSTRQYVELTLPDGAEVTNAFIDGRKIRPAVREGALLFPLRQSERLAAGKERIHVVRPGETLSDVANLYYSDPSAWTRILAMNRDVVGQSGWLTRGSRLRIPAAATDAGKEASFVIEVSYERSAGRFAALGWRTVRLPGLDVDTMKVVWHLYLPSSHEPLTFRGNLVQTSNIKYDIFRRVQWYLERATSVPSAFAGEYKNILTKRRAIYNNEAKAQGDDGAALTTFPLVGERTRFRRILLGRETPEIRVLLASSSLVGAARIAALLITLCATLWALGARRSRWDTRRSRWGTRRRWLLSAGAIAILLVAAHYVPGMYRRILWGMDLALLAGLARLVGPWLLRAARIAVRAPWRAARAFTLRRLLAAAGFAWLLGLTAAYPMLFSMVALACMSILWWRTASVREVRHAR